MHMQRVHLRHGAISIGGVALSKVRPMLIRLERGWFPTRSNGDTLRDKLKALAAEMPDQFSEPSRLFLQAI